MAGHDWLAVGQSESVAQCLQSVAQLSKQRAKEGEKERATGSSIKMCFVKRFHSLFAIEKGNNAYVIIKYMFIYI